MCEGIINPCGLIAHSLFNDTFTLESAVDSRNNTLGLMMKVSGDFALYMLFG